jgi:hypothetical protein
MGRDANTCGRLRLTIAFNTDSVSLPTNIRHRRAPNCSRETISINGLLKQYAVDRVRKVWTVLAGIEPVEDH